MLVFGDVCVNPDSVLCVTRNGDESKLLLRVPDDALGNNVSQVVLDCTYDAATALIEYFKLKT